MADLLFYRLCGLDSGVVSCLVLSSEKGIAAPIFQYSLLSIYFTIFLQTKTVRALEP